MEYGICPVCNGSSRASAGHLKGGKYIRGYDEKTDTLPCFNCGGQTMAGVATGKVLLNKNNMPCYHEYKLIFLGNCWTKSICNHCGFEYEIDSSD